jgi:hypothetical protein
MAELAGTWTFRSFNPMFITGNPTFVSGNETPQEDGFTAGRMDLTLRTVPDPMYLEGTIGWRGDPPRDPPGVLDVNLTIDQTPGLEHQRFNFSATGRAQRAYGAEPGYAG